MLILPSNFQAQPQAQSAAEQPVKLTVLLAQAGKGKLGANGKHREVARGLLQVTLKSIEGTIPMVDDEGKPYYLTNDDVREAGLILSFNNAEDQQQIVQTFQSSKQFQSDNGSAMEFRVIATGFELQQNTLGAGGLTCTVLPGQCGDFKSPTNTVRLSRNAALEQIRANVQNNLSVRQAGLAMRQAANTNVKPANAAVAAGAAAAIPDASQLAK